MLYPLFFPLPTALFSCLLCPRPALTAFSCVSYNTSCMQLHYAAMASTMTATTTLPHPLAVSPSPFPLSTPRPPASVPLPHSFYPLFVSFLTPYSHYFISNTAQKSGGKKSCNSFFHEDDHHILHLFGSLPLLYLASQQQASGIDSKKTTPTKTRATKNKDDFTLLQLFHLLVAVVVSYYFLFVITSLFTHALYGWRFNIDGIGVTGCLLPSLFYYLLSSPQHLIHFVNLFDALWGDNSSQLPGVAPRRRASMPTLSISEPIVLLFFGRCPTSLQRV